MIPMLFAVVACAAPAGWLAGEVFADMHEDLDPGLAAMLPYAAAIFPPFAGVLAFVCIVKGNLK